MAIQRPADARPVVAHAFRGFIEMSLKVRPELCNANQKLAD